MEMKQYLLPVLLLIQSTGSTAMAGVYIGPGLFIQRMSAANSSATVLQPRLSLGVDTLSGDYYFAGEIFASPFTHTLSNSTQTGAVDAKTTTSFGLAFLPGIKISNDLLTYLRLGAIRTWFSGPKSGQNGGILGIGAAVPLNNHWDARAEYNYTFYRAVTGLGHPKANSLGLGLVYSF